MAAKRKYNTLTISEKLTIINAVDKGQKTKTEIAKEFGIPLSTLLTFLKNRESIETAVARGDDITTRKRIRGAKHEDLEDQLFEWFCHARANNIPISGSFIKEKAEEISSKLGIEFNASNGWIQRFKKRHNISSVCVVGESRSVDVEATEVWRAGIQSLLDTYEPKDIFNCDETGVFYNLQPDRTLHVKGETCHGGKKSKERLTVLLACNSDGSEKLKPLVIGKYKKPRCFKGVSHFPPADYEANKNAWMTAKIFVEWLLQLERKMLSQGRKILLLMDNCAAHNLSGLSLNNVRVLFFPPNSTSHLQPLDQGIISCLKHYYRKKLVRYYLQEVSKHVPASEIRKWNVLDAMRNICAAWNSIQPNVIANCFAKAGFGVRMHPAEMEHDVEEVDFDWRELQHHLNSTDLNSTFDDYVHADRELATTISFQQGEELSSNVLTPEAHLDEVDSSDEECAPCPSKQEALAALSVIEKMLPYLDNENAEIIERTSQSVHNFFRKNPRQRLITSFLTKQ